MGVKKNDNRPPDYIPSVNETKWYSYCVKNNIRVSYFPVQYEKGKWKITINIGPYKKGETAHVSPATYDKYSLWQTYYQVCKYYYNKR